MSEIVQNNTVRMPKISVFTLGCKVNQYDGDAMLAIFERNGFEVTEGLEYADVYVLNTCAVTAEAEKKSRQSIARILKINPNARIYVCGCASQNNFSQFAKDGVRYISGADNKVELARKIAAKFKAEFYEENAFDKIIASDFSVSEKYEDNEGIYNLRTRHFIKIQDGCNNFCSYCIVPYLRGRSRSRSLFSILTELDEVKNSAKEVVITGINLSAYGKDINISLTELLGALQNYDMRFRLGSLEVNVIDESFLAATRNLKKFCPHFHLSLQSGDDYILKQMNRHYDTKQYAAAVELIRTYYPSAAITTDIIVGYPGESDEEFENSLQFARKIGFADIHVFPYSSRKGTVAGRMPTLPSELVDARQKRMTQLKHQLATEYLQSHIGLPCEVLYETREDGLWCGHTPNYVKVYSENGARNMIQKVAPVALYKDGLIV